MSDQQKNNGRKDSKPLIIVVAILVLAVVIGAIALTMNGQTGNGPEIAQPAAGNGEEVTTATEQVAPGDPVVAVVNGQEIHRSEVFDFIGTLPPQVRQMPVQTIFPLAQEQVVNNHIVQRRAEGANLAQDEEVQRQLEQAREQIVRSVYIERQIDRRMTNERLRSAYDQAVAEMGRVEEIRASHILVETQEQAQDIIRQIEQGADFAELAREHSIDPVAEQGGHLGFFARDEMVPEFANAAFAIAPGDHSQAPTQTQFGWHVIMVHEQRERPAPSFEDVRPQLESHVRQEILTELVNEWRQGIDVTKFDINGQPISD